MIIARQSTARTVIVGPVLDADGVAVTDRTVSALKISKNGANPAALNGSATLTHRHTGHYSLALTTSDLDTVGQAEIVIDDTVNAMPIKTITVIEEAVYDRDFVASATGLVTLAAVTHTGATIPTVTTTGTATAVTTVNGLAANVITATSIQNDAITAAKIANAAIDAATFAADVDAEILSYLVDDATRIDASAANAASSRVATALPNAAPAGNGGLPTVDANNRVVGIQGTITTLDALDTAQDSQHSTTQGLVTTVDGVVDAILVDTAEIGAAGAGLTALASAAALATVDGLIDTLVAALVTLAVKTGAVVTNGSNSATSFDTNLTETEDDHWKDAFLVLTSGDLTGQVKKVTAFNGTSKVITVSGGFTDIPADGVTFALVNR